MKRLPILLCALIIVIQTTVAQNSDVIQGITKTGNQGIQETMESIMTRQETRDASKYMKTTRMLKRRIVDQTRSYKHNNPDAPEVSQLPLPTKNFLQEASENIRAPQTVGLTFLGSQFSDSFYFPPDSMGAAGPTQFVVAINGRVKSINKTTGVADGILNADLDMFFDPVRNNKFTTDPRIRYDRFSERWFVMCINVPNNFTNNRIMIAVSNTATITPATLWTYFYFNAGTSIFLDYPTLGIDVNALYIGGVTFASNGNFDKVFVVRKSTILGAGPIVYTTFDNVIDLNTGVGPYCPQGVDNFDKDATIGYFIGVNNAEFGSLVLRRISDPAGTPTMSANKVVVVPSTQLPITVNHKGNTGGVNGRLDGIDDRLYMAHIRNDSLWTTHNIGVDNHGVSNDRRQRTRNGSRWYEIDVSVSDPELVQVGTLFKATKENVTRAISYWIPAIMTSGQGHMALGCSTAGQNKYINCATAGRLASGAQGTLQSPVKYTNVEVSYNPPQDPGSSEGRRWGDYSYTSLDPCDDMTMWTIQEYCNKTNSWGVRVAKLLAPPPATPSSASTSVSQGNSSANVTITGTVVNGSGFYDPGADFDCRIAASVSGGVTVNSITYNSPTSVTLNISTVGASTGNKNVTITNPDGQSRTGTGILTVT